MIRTDTTYLLPFECLACKESRPPYVDTLVDTLQGRLYICHVCADQFARLLGLYAPLRARITELDGIAEGLELALEAERAARDRDRQAVVQTLRHGAVTQQGVIVARQRPPRKRKVTT